MHAKNTIKYLSYTKLTTRVEFIETVIQITISLFFSNFIDFLFFIFGGDDDLGGEDTVELFSVLLLELVGST